VGSACGRRALAVSILLFVGGCEQGGADDPSAAAPSACTYAAALGGDDEGPGTPEEPFATFEALANALAPGETGCLNEGEPGDAFEADELVIDDPGITITSSPGERATLRGRVYVAGDAEGSRLERVDIDLAGQTPQDVGVQINAPEFTLSRSTVVDDQNQICLAIGADDPSFGTGDGVVVEDNEIRGCGASGDNFAQGVYLNGADDAVISRNEIRGVSARGIQLVGDADGNLISGNLVYENGQSLGFGSLDEEVPDDNVVEANVFADPLSRINVGFALEPGDPQPTGNLLRGNCLWIGERNVAGIELLADRELPIEVADNLVADPGRSGGAVSGRCAGLKP
jgi:parallel beta-helix repeat protein